MSNISFILSNRNWLNIEKYINTDDINIKIHILALFAKFSQNPDAMDLLSRAQKSKYETLSTTLKLVSQCILNNSENNLKEISKNTTQQLFNEWKKDYVLKHLIVLKINEDDTYLSKYMYTLFELSDPTKPLLNIKQKLSYNDTILGRKSSHKIVDIFENILKTRNFVLTDATSSIGLNSINFASLGVSKVNAVENHLYSFIALKNNVEAFNIDNINMIYGSYCECYLYQKIKQDCVYIDVLDFYIDHTNGDSIGEIINNLLDKKLAKVIICKFPRTTTFNIRNSLEKGSKKSVEEQTHLEKILEEDVNTIKLKKDPKKRNWNTIDIDKNYTLLIIGFP